MYERPDGDEENQELLQLCRSLGHHLNFMGEFPVIRKKILYGRLPFNISESMPPERLHTSLENVQAELGECKRCSLCNTRKSIIFGEGDEHAQLVFVGEAPGADEDAQGRPFVGQAGQLLSKIIEAMKLDRKNVYICNILKCRPPGNRNPRPLEIASCEPFLIKQLDVIKPQVICALGSFAAQTLLKSETPITVLRGHFHKYQGIDVMPTYHPAYLLRNPTAKKHVWEDVQKIMKRLEMMAR